MFLIALAALILLFCCLQRRKNKKEDDFDQEKATTGAATGAAAGVAAGSGSPELTGPGFGTTVDLDDRDENAKQLAALNVLKLDEKDKLASDAHSTSSSITHVSQNTVMILGTSMHLKSHLSLGELMINQILQREE